MTVYGLDIAHYQSGLDLKTARDQGYVFCMAKVTEGKSFADSAYAGFRDAAKAERLLFVASHFLRSDSDPADQAKWCMSQVGDKSIPIMVDTESGTNGSKPTMVHVTKFVSAVSALGGRVTLNYLPHWYWTQIGSPVISGPRLIASNYVSGTDFASKLYPGDTSARWGAYGGQTPVILQFSSSGKYSGYSSKVDVNAFRGTEAELKALGLFKDWTPPVVPAVNEFTMLALAGLSLPVLKYGMKDKDYPGYDMIWRLQKMLRVTPTQVYDAATVQALKTYMGSGDGKTCGLAEWTKLYGLSRR